MKLLKINFQANFSDCMMIEVSPTYKIALR